MLEQPGWRPPEPPRDLNGWGTYMTRMVEHMRVRLHYVEQSHNDLKLEIRAKSASAPAADTPSLSGVGNTAKEVGIATKEIVLALRWVALIILLIALSTNRIDLNAISKIGLGRLLSGA